MVWQVAPRPASNSRQAAAPWASCAAGEAGEIEQAVAARPDAATGAGAAMRGPRLDGRPCGARGSRRHGTRQTTRISGSGRAQSERDGVFHPAARRRLRGNRALPRRLGGGDRKRPREYLCVNKIEALRNAAPARPLAHVEPPPAGPNMAAAAGASSSALGRGSPHRSPLNPNYPGRISPTLASFPMFRRAAS